MKTEHDWIVRVYDPQNSIVTEYIIENRTENQAAGEAERDFEVINKKGIIYNVHPRLVPADYTRYISVGRSHNFTSTDVCNSPASTSLNNRKII